MRWLFLILGSAFLALGIWAQAESNNSLWTDTNPYSQRNTVGIGTTVRILFEKGFQAEWKLESQSEDTHKISSHPSKSFVQEMPKYESDRTIAKKLNGKIKSEGNLKGSLTVVVREIDESTGLLRLEGERATVFNGEEQRIQLQGYVSRELISKKRTIDASQVANLQVIFSGTLAPKNLQNPNVQLKTTQNQDGTTSSKAELSNEEQQQLILQYMKRLLGESQ